MQFQADIIDKPVVRPGSVESTSFGAARLAGLGAGVWENAGELQGLGTDRREFAPSMDPAQRHSLLDGWRRALRQARTR